TDLALKFVEHLSLITDALQTQDLWDEEDGLFYDRLRSPDGSSQSVRVRSIVSILPLLAVAIADKRAVESAKTVNKMGAALVERRQAELARLKEAGVVPADAGKAPCCSGSSASSACSGSSRSCSTRASSSPRTARAVSRYHAEHPFAIEIDGNTSSIDYEPAE